jgi:hypothetical protein
MLEYGWMWWVIVVIATPGSLAFFLEQMREARIIADLFYLREDQSNGRFC